MLLPLSQRTIAKKSPPVRRVAGRGATGVVKGGPGGVAAPWGPAHPSAGSVGAQWKESPQAQVLVALGLSMVNPCFSMVSMKSMVAPDRYGALIRSVTTSTPS